MKNGKRYRTGICDPNAFEVKNAILNIAASGDEGNNAIHWPKESETASAASSANHIGLGTIENLGGLDPTLNEKDLTNTHHTIADKKQ